jgi:copper resistance protein B
MRSRSVRGYCVVAWGVFGAAGLLTGLARADGGDASSAAPFGQPVADDRVYVHGLLDEFEGRFGGGSESSFRWDGEAWVGGDTNRLWLKSEGFAEGGRVEDGEHELLYARAISPYFDLQAGARYDLDSEPGRAWAALGIEGLAPYFFHVSATAYARDAGHVAAKFTGSYELLLTQRLIVEPQAELNIYGKSDAARRTGTGLSDIDAGIRARYEFSRKLAPYVGFAYEHKFGQSGRYASLDGAHEVELRAVVGIRTWF